MDADNSPRYPYVEINGRKWARIAKARGYRKRLMHPRSAMLDNPAAFTALQGGSTLLSVRFVGHIHRGWRDIGLFVNAECAVFPLDRPGYVRVSDYPVLLVPYSPSAFRRFALLYPLEGAINEVTIRMNWLSPYGQDGVWRPNQTRLVPSEELEHPNTRPR